MAKREVRLSETQAEESARKNALWQREKLLDQRDALTKALPTIKKLISTGESTLTTLADLQVLVAKLPDAVQGAQTVMTRDGTGVRPVAEIKDVLADLLTHSITWCERRLDTHEESLKRTQKMLKSAEEALKQYPAVEEQAA